MLFPSKLPTSQGVFAVLLLLLLRFLMLTNLSHLYFRLITSDFISYYLVGV